MQGSYAEEALRCRTQAKEFAGKPEQPFMLKISEAFEELALMRNVASREAARDEEFTARS